MLVIKKINNNVAICLDSAGRELVAMGKGIGFPKTPYELMDMGKIDRTFYDINSQYFALLNDIPGEVIQFTAEMMDRIRGQLPYQTNSNIVITLADHIAFTIIYKAADKYCPKILSSFMIPVIVFGVSIPVGFVVIGPVFNTIAQVISDGIMALYDKLPIVAALILGMAWQVLVIFGMHSVFSILAVMQMSSGLGTPILAMIFPAFFAQAMTVWAIFLRTKSQRLRSVSMSAGISALLGVTEPAIYSVTLPRLKYFIYSCIGTAGDALVMALTGTLRYSLGGLGFLCIPTFFGEGVTMSDVVFPITVSLLVAGGIAFALTFLTYKDDQMDLE